MHNATAALLRCPRALRRIAPFSEPGKLAFLWFCYGNYGNYTAKNNWARFDTDRRKVSNRGQ